MGKRRKPVRKPNYQSIDEIKVNNMRMAGDELSLLMEPREERPLGTAYERLLETAERFNMIDNELMQAGIPASEFSGMQRLQIPQLKGGVPAPYVKKESDIERRIHLVEEDGELFPIANNNPQAGPYLVTEFGKNVNQEGEKKATEYVQDHILRLMGFDPVRGPKGKVDFYVKHNGKRVGVDGQTSRTSWNPSVQAYAKVIPTQRERGGYGHGRAPSRTNPYGKNTKANESAITNDIRKSLASEMDGNTTLKSAIQNLIDKRLIVDDPWLKGKAYRDDYQAVIMPVLNAKDHIANRAAKDTLSIAPDRVVSYKMSDAKNVVDNITNSNQLMINPNTSDNGRGELRGAISVEVPREIVKDVTQVHPYVQQILRQLPYA